MKAEEFIKRLEAIIEEQGKDLEVVVYAETRSYLSPIASILVINGVDMLVIM